MNVAETLVVTTGLGTDMTTHVVKDLVTSAK